MTTESATFTGDSGARVVPAPAETPEERAAAVRAHRQAYDNMGYLLEILDDLEREHPGRLVLVYGDRQVMIGDDGYAMKQSLSEVDRKGTAFLPIGPWTEYGVR